MNKCSTAANEDLFMQISLTSKVKLLPDDNSKSLILDTMRVYREACNYVSSYIFAMQTTDLRLLQKELYYDLRDRFKIRSQMTISVLRTVRARYITLEANKQPWALIRFKKPQLDLVWNRDYSLLGDMFSLNTLEGRKKMSFADPYTPLKGKLGTAKLIYRHNNFFLYIPVTYETPDVCEKDIRNVVGIDRGIRFVATTYDRQGKTVFYSGAKIRERKIHFERIRRQLREVGTPSAKRRLRAIGRKEHRWMQDVNHCISKALTESQPRGTLFVLEDLTDIVSASRKNVSKRRHLHLFWAYYDLEEKIIYKAALRGQMVIKVDPSYTSQTCPLCGRRNRNSRIREKHLFRCTVCRYKSNDDRVAAINLYGKGIMYLVQSGESMPLFGGA